MSRRPNQGRVYGSPIPTAAQQVGPFTQGYSGITVYTSLLPLLRWPEAVLEGIWVARRIWMFFGKNESGATSEIHTQIEWRSGPTTLPLSYDVVTTLTTENNPSAGEVMSADISYIPDAGETLYPWITKVGGGAADFNNALVFSGVECVRIPL